MYRTKIGPTADIDITNLLTQIEEGVIIKSEDQLMVVQFKWEAKLSTLIGLIKLCIQFSAGYVVTYLFVARDNLFELFQKI